MIVNSNHSISRNKKNNRYLRFSKAPPKAVHKRTATPHMANALTNKKNKWDITLNHPYTTTPSSPSADTDRYHYVTISDDSDLRL
jgi:hypothetical protein